MIQDVVDALTPLLPGVPVLVGKKYIAADGVPPRVVLVPSRDRIAPPQRVGGVQRAIHTRFAGVQMHVWGADVATTEALVHQVLVAIRAAVSTLGVLVIAPDGYKALDGGWLDNSWAQLGEVWVGNLEFAFPVTAPALPTQTITSIPQTNQLETPGNPPSEEDAG